MKIIRLTESEEGVAFFDNIFNDEINLPPFSEVALASVSINTDPASIEVPVGSQLRWKRDVTSNISDLTARTYTSATYENLFFDIQANMNLNQQADPANDGAGRQWAVSDKPNVTGFGVGGKVSIGYQTANYEGGAEEAYEHTNVTETKDADSALDDTYAKDDAAEISGLASSEPLGWGRSRFYVNMKTITNSGSGVSLEEGVFIGLSTINHAKEKTLPVVGDADIFMGIHVPHLGIKANVYGGDNDDEAEDQTVNNIAADSLFGFQSNDVGGDEGRTIMGVHYLADGTGGLIVTSNGNFVGDYNEIDHGDLGSEDNSPLYPFVLFLGPAANTVVNEIQLSPDPYSIIANKNYDVITKTNGTRGLQNKGELPVVNLDFRNSTPIGQFLGYSNSTMKNMTTDRTAKEATKYAWGADDLFGQGVKGQGFYVELMTGTCEGYDGKTGQRKNILAVIPESDSDDKILFQPNFPMFLEMNNSHPLVLRNIRARLLQTDGSQVEVLGFNSMTLLFKPGKSQ